MNEQEIQALKNTAKYEFYKEYVEQLEIAHDELLEKNITLERRKKRLEEELRVTKDLLQESLNGSKMEELKQENARIRDTAQKVALKYKHAQEILRNQTGVKLSKTDLTIEEVEYILHRMKVMKNNATTKDVIRKIAAIVAKLEKIID